jgi:hypothetical protein
MPNYPSGYKAWFDPKNQPKEQAMTERQTEYETELEGMSNKEFEVLKDAIRDAWKEYERLQQIYRQQTGVRYEWFK